MLLTSSHQNVSCECLWKIISQVLNYIDRKISIDDLAKNMKLSPKYFIDKYKKLSGETPMRAVRRIRLAQARMLLLTTGMTLKEVARMVGLSNEYHLSRLLRQQYGVTITAIR